METMKMIYRNSHFELVPAEKLPEYGNRIVQIGHATRGLNASVSYLCEVQAEPDFPVCVSELKLDDISEEKRDEVEKAIIEKTYIAYGGEMPRAVAEVRKTED